LRLCGELKEIYMEGKTIIQIYTGTGKGKTTAALGLALRARAHELTVGLVSFHKNPDRWGYREDEKLIEIGVEINRFAVKHPFCDKDVTEDDLRADCKEGLEFIKGLFEKETYDVLIIDELLISVRDGYMDEQDVLDLFDSKPDSMELVVTGRGATPRMIERADLVSNIEMVKHPYEQGLQARKGIEF